MYYPLVLIFRYDTYPEIDYLLNENKSALKFSYEITSDHITLNKMYDPNYPVLVTYGSTPEEYYTDVYKVIPDRMNHRWVHITSSHTIDQINNGVNSCFIDVAIAERSRTRVTYSIFTTCFNSYEKIDRVYESIKNQTFIDWEWVILDDSPDDKHFDDLRKKFLADKKIRLYRRGENSGNIGNVKNEVVALCRGKYALEMDHDDELLPDVLKDSVKIFEENPDVGFVYMDCINLYENKGNFCYGNFCGKGYVGYYCMKFNDQWVYVYSIPQINNITASHLVCMPNHPRIWRTQTLLELGNYSEFLPICDDFEILLRTSIGTKMAKIAKLGYVQYMNNNNNNFSLIRNREINRIGPQYIMPQFYSKYNVNEKMKEFDAHENEDYIYHQSQVWKRENYEPKFCTKLFNLDYDMQYCVIGIETLLLKIDEIKEIYQNPRNDIIVLDHHCEVTDMWKLLDEYGLDRMKCYAMSDCTDEQLEKYFMLTYKSCEKFQVIKE